MDKIIKQFIINLNDLPFRLTKRKFTIIGDVNSEFILEIKNEDGYYYNFTTDSFQVAKTRLEDVLTSASYSGIITFPAITDDDQYDIYLYAKPGTKHAEHVESRFPDGSLDINNSTGSNSLMMQKVIYQYTALTLTLAGFSLTGGVAGTFGTDTISVDRGGTLNKTPFSFTTTAGATAAYRILKQPTYDEILSFLEPTIGSAPEDIYTENIYPTATAAFTGDDVNGAVTSGSVVRMDGSAGTNLTVGDKITTATTTGTVDGAIADGTVVTLDQTCSTIMAVGDQVTGTPADAAGTILEVTVVGTGGNANRFTVNEATAFEDGATLTFSSKVNRSLTTVTVVATSGTDTDFTMSQAIQFRDNAPLSFFRQKNYRWPVSNIAGINKNMILDPSKTAVNTALNSFVADYDDSTTITSSVYDGDVGFVDTEITLPNVFVDAITPTGSATVDRLGITTAQAGNLVFNNQQALALKDDTSIKILGYGLANIKSLTYGADLEFSDLKVELTAITTATSSAVSSSTSIPLDERAGIMDGQSIMTGIGVSGENIKVVSGASGNTGAGTIVVSAAQTIEDNQTLTFANASNVATITGNVTIKSIPTSNSVVYFDVEKFLTCF